MYNLSFEENPREFLETEASYEHSMRLLDMINDLYKCVLITCANKNAQQHSNHKT